MILKKNMLTMSLFPCFHTLAHISLFHALPHYHNTTINPLSVQFIIIPIDHTLPILPLFVLLVGILFHSFSVDLYSLGCRADLSSVPNSFGRSTRLYLEIRGLEFLDDLVASPPGTAVSSLVYSFSVVLSQHSMHIFLYRIGKTRIMSSD